MSGPVQPQTGSQLQGPIYSNFQNTLQLVSNVTNELNAIVTTGTDHGYTTGMYVLLSVPPTYGMSILDRSYITVLSDTTFQTTIDTSQQLPFVAPTLYPPSAFTPAQVVPISFTEMNIAPL